MMKIITSNDVLLQYIPNVFATVEGEKPLYEKIKHFLKTSEAWLTKNLIGEETLSMIAEGEHDTRYVNVALAIVARALFLAIPSLDVVLTPNGFGIISNDTVAPASKERVERLISTLKLIESQCIAVLLPMLRSTTQWHSSKQCKWLASSIIQDMSLLPDTDKNWEGFISFRQQVYDIEQTISNEWISPQLMERFRLSEATATYGEGIERLVYSLKMVVISSYNRGCLNKRILDDIVSYIRNFPDQFPEWHGSANAKLFAPVVFVNDKKAGGYFF